MSRIETGLNTHTISQDETGNSTKVLLTSSATYTGAWEDVSSFATVAVAVFGSNTTDGTLYIESSQDGGVTVNSVPYPIEDATFALPRVWNVVESHIRVRYTNGTTAQTTFFQLQTKYSNSQQLGLLQSAGDTINVNTAVQITKSVTTGAKPDGSYANNPHNGVAFKETTPIAGAGNYTSDWIDTDAYNVVELFIKTDELSAVNGIVLEFTDELDSPSVQETALFSFTELDISRGYLEVHFTPRLVGFRLNYNNGSTIQGSLLIQCDLKTNGAPSSYNGGGALIVGDFDTEVALGNVPNYIREEKFGSVFEMDAADGAATVWNAANDTLANRIPRKTWKSTSAAIWIASSSGSDTSKDITFCYNDANNELQKTTVTLNGQTPVDTGVSGFDCNTAYLSSNGDVLAGDVWIQQGNAFSSGVPDDDTNVLAYIDPSMGRTQQATFRVPSDKEMIIDSIFLSISRVSGGATSADIFLRIKPEGGSWYVLRYFNTTSTSGVDKREQIVIDSGTYVEFHTDNISDNDTTVSCQFGYTLVTKQ